MDLAVAQFLVVQAHLPGRLAGLLLDARDRLALLLVLDDLPLENLRRLGVLVQVVVEVLGEEVGHEVVDRDPRFDLLRTVLGLHLVLEDRVGDLDRNGRDDRRADVRGVVVLVVEFLDRLGDGGAQGRLVRAALRGVLAVDERVVALAVARAVGDHHLDVLPREVDGRVERVLGHVVVHEVQQTVFRNVALAVEIERQTQVQVAVIADFLLDVFEVVGIFAENLLVDAVRDERAVLLVDAALPPVAHFETLGEGHRTGLAVADRTGRKLFGKHVHGLDAHTVQAHGLLEGVASVLAARVHLPDGRRERLEGDAAAVVAHRNDVVGQRDVDLPARAHDEFVDRVVHDLLDQHVERLVGLRTVAHHADVHAGAQADVLPRREGHDGVVAVIVCVRVGIIE